MFLTVVIFTVALIIFFGAWAVASDAEGRELTFALTGADLEDANVTGKEGEEQASNAFGAGAIGGDPSDDALSDTWWGQGFLKACPLH